MTDSIYQTNILIGDDGGVRITDPYLDFRLRQLIYDIDGYFSIPSSYQYKSPEELCDPSHISQEGDVYSWASVIYEASLA